MNHLVRPATWDDVVFVAERMKQEDQEECAAGGLTPLQALKQSYDHSFLTYAILKPDTMEAGALMGVCQGPIPSWGAIWLLCTPAVFEHRFQFALNAQEVVSWLFEVSGKECFYNYTFCGNDAHHRLLRWLGFKFLRKVSLPPHDQEFFEFVKLKG